MKNNPLCFANCMSHIRMDGLKVVTLAFVMLLSITMTSSVQADQKLIKQALLIGMDQENALIGLPFVPAIDRDITRMKKLLEKQGYEVITMMNPNRQMAMQKFEELAVMSATDEFLFYYSGHSVDNENHGYLVPVLTAEAGNAARQAVDNGQNPFAAKQLTDELISSSELHSLLRLSLASRQVIIIDGNTRQLCLPKLFTETIQSLHFFCAGPGAVAKPDGGVFTSLILKGLKGKADTGGDDQVDAMELEAWLKRSIPEALGEKSTLMRNPAFFHFGENQVLSDLMQNPAE